VSLMYHDSAAVSGRRYVWCRRNRYRGQQVAHSAALALQILARLHGLVGSVNVEHGVARLAGQRYHVSVHIYGGDATDGAHNDAVANARCCVERQHRNGVGCRRG
jgi:hypothetical protein